MVYNNSCEIGRVLVWVGESVVRVRTIVRQGMCGMVWTDLDRHSSAVETKRKETSLALQSLITNSKLKKTEKQGLYITTLADSTFHYTHTSA